jgi:hypothetical protein
MGNQKRHTRCPPRSHSPPAAPPSGASTSTAVRHSLRRATYRQNIPVTTIQRTIDDLDRSVPPYLLRHARRQAELMNIRLKGAESRRARSDLEEEFFALYPPPPHPVPETNIKLGRWEVDFLWREQRLVVEADCFLYLGGFGETIGESLELHG